MAKQAPTHRDIQVLQQIGRVVCLVTMFGLMLILGSNQHSAVVGAVILLYLLVVTFALFRQLR